MRDASITGFETHFGQVITLRTRTIGMLLLVFSLIKGLDGTRFHNTVPLSKGECSRPASEQPRDCTAYQDR